MTAPYNLQAIRSLLEVHKDGLTIPEMTQITGIEGPALSAAVRRDERIYIDRWTTSRHSHQWVAVWCFAPIPEHAPRPAIKPSDYLKAMEAARV